MFVYSSAKASGLYVGIYSGNMITDDHYELCVSSMTEFERGLRGQPEGLSAILVSDPGVPAVPASWRKRMASFNESVQAPQYLLAIVTPSSVIRGILTAINWLSPPKQGHQRMAHDTFAAARSWIETHRGRPEPQLAELYRSARAKVALPQTG